MSLFQLFVTSGRCKKLLNRILYKHFKPRNSQSFQEDELSKKHFLTRELCTLSIFIGMGRRSQMRIILDQSISRF